LSVCVRLGQRRKIGGFFSLSGKGDIKQAEIELH